MFFFFFLIVYLHILKILGGAAQPKRWRRSSLSSERRGGARPDLDGFPGSPSPSAGAAEEKRRLERQTPLPRPANSSSVCSAEGSGRQPGRLLCGCTQGPRFFFEICIQYAANEGVLNVGRVGKVTAE